MSDRFDVVIVGGGILGLAVARELLSRCPSAQIAVVEKEAVVGAHQTGHNSGVIHSGVYYTPGSLKARLCVDGARLMYDYCDKNDLAYERCGKLIVAASHGDLQRLDEIERRGIANGITGLQRIDGPQIPEIEPNAVGVSALHVPSTGIVDFRTVAECLHADIERMGAQLYLGMEATQIEPRRDGAAVVMESGRLHATHVVACAGLWSDRLAQSSKTKMQVRIVPFRGAYLRVRATHPPLVRGMVYPVPDPTLPFLGVHITRHLDGSVSLGPTAMIALARDGYGLLDFRAQDVYSILSWPGTWRLGKKYWRTGVKEAWMALRRDAILEEARRYVPNIGPEIILEGTDAGVRAQAVGRDGTLVDDFAIGSEPGITHVVNAPSPAATSALALAKEVVDRIPTWGRQ